MKGDFSIVFMPTYACNCDCVHCFEKIMPLTIEPDSWGYYLGQLKDFAYQKELKKLLIYWQGGEVLTMQPDIVRQGLETCRSIMDNAGIEVEHHLQSNLLLYDGRWKDIITEHFRGNISSSLDYPNIYRKSKAPACDDYNEKWLEKKYEAEADGLVVHLITLPNWATLERGAADFYRYFSDDIGVKNVQINLPFTGADGVNPAALSLDKLGVFMQDLYEVWVESERHLNLNPFFALENRIYKGNGRLPCAWSYNCADFIFAVGPDGEIGQCDCWVSNHKNYNFGVLGKSSLNDFWDSANRKLFVERPTRMIHDPECGQCKYWGICFGGCPIRAMAFSGDMYSRDYYCPVYKKIFAAVLGDK